MKPVPTSTGKSDLVDRGDIGTLPVKVAGEKVLLVDQRALPEKVEYFDATALEDMCYALSEMVVRGAPSIGVAAALGLAAQGRQLASKNLTLSGFLDALDKARLNLQSTRPTAVNLNWATDKIYLEAQEICSGPKGIETKALADRLFARAEELLNEHIQTNMKLSSLGMAVVPNRASVLTHCNAGSLATCGWGTALGVIRSANFAGLNPTVFVDETRPRLQGGRLTVWELRQDGIPCTLICDSLAAYLMAQRKIDLVIVGADRIALNGDTANKVGTYGLAVLAKAHGIPFYVAAPLSTVDANLERGDEIKLEERSPAEIIKFGDTLTSLPDAAALNLAFDVTPGKLITGMITEEGILYPEYEQAIPAALKSASATKTKRNEGT